MKVYVNDNLEIKSVDVSVEGLTELEIDDENNPFKDWSKAKICSYKCTVSNGAVTMMTPYRDSRSLDYIDEVGKESDKQEEALNILFGNEEV